MKLAKLFLISLFCIACKSKKKNVDTVTREELPLLTNDSVYKFIEVDKKIVNKVENITSFSNPFRKHLREHISTRALKKFNLKNGEVRYILNFPLIKEDKSPI